MPDPYVTAPDPGDEDRDAWPCCGDPLCPCAKKPGWGPYAPSPGRWLLPEGDLDVEGPL